MPLFPFASVLQETFFKARTSTILNAARPCPTELVLVVLWIAVRFVVILVIVLHGFMKTTMTTMRNPTAGRLAIIKVPLTTTPEFWVKLAVAWPPKIVICWIYMVSFMDMTILVL